tara:strand:+ start:170 stop:349 length:180 start_codon:yes stop_codon:yes gene_type:complete
MTFSSEFEKQEFIQKVIDRLLYCPGFKEKLEDVIKKYEIPESVKLTYKLHGFSYTKEKT